jgi:hypothetical protein
MYMLYIFVRVFLVVYLTFTIFFLHQAYIIVAAQSIPSQNDNKVNQNSTEAEPDTAKNNDFLKDMILVLIPTVIGAVTSKFIVNSWQSTKEKNDIKRKILAEYDSHVAKTFTLIGIFVEQIIREIKNSPIEELPNECKKFKDEYWQLSYAANQLLRSLRLYYKDENHELEKQYQHILNEFGEVYGYCEKFINSNKYDEAFSYKKTIDEKLLVILNLMKHLESKLIKEKIVIR